MIVDLKNELQALKDAAKNLNEKLTAAFKDKWVLALDFRESRILFRTDEPSFLKNRNGDYIAFKVTSCRIKSKPIVSEYYANEIIIEGYDKFGNFRSVPFKREGFYSSKVPSRNLINESIFEYKVDSFDTEEEAILYATLKAQVEDNE